MMMMEKLSEFKEWKCRIVYLVDRSFIHSFKLYFLLGLGGVYDNGEYVFYACISLMGVEVLSYTIE